VLAVRDLAAVGELRAGFFQAPAEAMQEVSAGGAAALDQLQVDVGFAEGGRSSAIVRFVVTSATTSVPTVPA
jgi:hypothetical protein